MSTPPASTPVVTPIAPARWYEDARLQVAVMLILAALGGYLVGREVERENRYDTYWLLGATMGQDFDGVFIDYVYPGGPSDIAGIQRGDRIGAIDGRPVTTAAQARRFVSEHNPGDTVQVTIRRGDFTAQYPVILGFIIVMRPTEISVEPPVWPTYPPPPPINGTTQQGNLGVYYRMIEPGDPFSVRNGALIVTAWPGGPADDAGLVAGDILVDVGGQSLSRSYTLDDAISRYSAGDIVQITVLRTDGSKVVVKVRLDG